MSESDIRQVLVVIDIVDDQAVDVCNWLDFCERLFAKASDSISRGVPEEPDVEHGNAA
jgi:hypothetical protein